LDVQGKPVYFEQELLELVSFALTVLGGREETRPAVMTILKRLERLSLELAETQALSAQNVRQRICEHRANLALEAEEYDEAVKFAELGRSLARRDTAAYYNLTIELSKSFFGLGESEKAYSVLAEAIREVISNRLHREEAPALLRVAKRAEICGLDESSEFACAMAALAKYSGRISTRQFKKLWIEDPRKALDAIGEAL
jgi:tetratricopeptide (TPR) repeat protein